MWLVVVVLAVVVLAVIYESRPINKLQNGIILLIFKIYKIRNIDFVHNLIGIYIEIFMNMTSLL